VAVAPDGVEVAPGGLFFFFFSPSAEEEKGRAERGERARMGKSSGAPEEKSTSFPLGKRVKKTESVTLGGCLRPPFRLNSNCSF
jgi:hypothetical protein